MTPNKVLVHCSATKDSGTVSWGAIRYYHTIVLGWRDIGYHAGVERVKSGDHEYYEILMGRMWDEQGAHEPEANADSLGICFVGDFDNEAPTLGQLIVGAKQIAYWMRLFGISKDRVYGHNFFNPSKSCPGRLFNMDTLRGML
jgi:hypothetical protein